MEGATAGSGAQAVGAVLLHRPKLDGVNATALALMAGVSYQLARTAIVDPLTLATAAVTLLLLWRTKLNNAWYIAAGALIGLAHTLLA